MWFPKPKTSSNFSSLSLFIWCVGDKLEISWVRSEIFRRCIFWWWWCVQSRSLMMLVVSCIYLFKSIKRGPLIFFYSFTFCSLSHSRSLFYWKEKESGSTHTHRPVPLLTPPPVIYLPSGQMRSHTLMCSLCWCKSWLHRLLMFSSDHNQKSSLQILALGDICR